MSYDILKIRHGEDGMSFVPIKLKSRPFENIVQENVIHMRMFSDYSCPWCFLAEKYLESLNYDIQMEYIGIELHPNVPLHGKMIESGSCLKNTIRRINHRGKEYGVDIQDIAIGPNTHLALLIGEYAKKTGKQEAFVKTVMNAYFMNGLNISEQEVLETLAASVGIDDGWRSGIEELENALKENHKMAETYGVYSVPSFIINDTYLIYGFDDERVFEEVFERVM